MPTWQQTREKRAQILCTYLRPWTLQRSDAPRSVPHAASLDEPSPSSRLREKISPRHSYAKAWREYVRGHVVSETVARMIVAALLSTSCTLTVLEEEAADDDAEIPAKLLTQSVKHSFTTEMVATLPWLLRGAVNVLCLKADVS